MSRLSHSASPSASSSTARSPSRPFDGRLRDAGLAVLASLGAVLALATVLLGGYALAQAVTERVLAVLGASTPGVAVRRLMLWAGAVVPVVGLMPDLRDLTTIGVGEYRRQAVTRVLGIILLVVFMVTVGWILFLLFLVVALVDLVIQIVFNTEGISDENVLANLFDWLAELKSWLYFGEGSRPELRDTPGMGTAWRRDD